MTELDVSTLLARANAIADLDECQLELGGLLRQLKPNLNGTFLTFVRSLWPHLRRPDARAKALMIRAQAPQPLPMGPLPSASGDRSSSAPASDLRAAAPPGLDGRAARLYPALRPLLDLKPRARREAIAALSRETGMSVPTIYRHLKLVKTGGAAALNRKSRADRDTVRLPADVQQTYLRFRLDPQTSHWSVAVAIRQTQLAHRGLDISSSSLRRLEASIPASLQMKEQEWRRRFLPSIGGWDVPHINHTWTFDASKADLFVISDDGRRIYRPEVLAIVDEASQACLWLMYTEETPSVATLQATLLHAMLPKGTDWPMCGVPVHLHADNGKIQDSDWLKKVCHDVGNDLDLLRDVRHAQVRSPWMDGTVENFFRILHHCFEPLLAGYCGNKPTHRPAHCPDPAKPRTWQGLLTLDQLNEAGRVWVTTEYHNGFKHSALGMTRQEFWRLHSPGHVKLPDESYLRHALLQRDVRQIRRNSVRLDNMIFWAAELEGSDLLTAEVRWDPADLSYVTVIPPTGQLIRAERQWVRNVDNPEDYASLREQRKHTRREHKRLRESLNIVSSLPADQRTDYLDQLRRADEESKKTEPIPFPARVTRVAPRPTTLSDSEIETLFPDVGAHGHAPDPDPDPIVIDGMEI